MFGAIGFLPQFQQFVQGASATNSGLLLMPMMVAAMVVSLGGGQVISQTGRYKILPIVGAVLDRRRPGAVRHHGRRHLHDHDRASTWSILGAGMGCLMQTSTLIAQNSLELRDMGAGTGASTFLRNMGSSLGVSILGAVYAHHLTDSLRPEPE